MSRLRLLARAEALTGRDLGYLKSFEAHAHLQRLDYAEQRANWAVSHRPVSKDEIAAAEG